MMDRRDFLKVLGVVSVVPAVLAKAVVAESEVPKFSTLRNGSSLFDPARSCGDFLTVSEYIDPGDPTDPVLNTAMRFLEESAHSFVPEEYRWCIRYEVNWPGRNTDPLNQLTTVTWKYKPMTATGARLYFGSCRSGKTNMMAANMARDIDDHVWDVVGYGMKGV